MGDAHRSGQLVDSLRQPTFPHHLLDDESFIQKNFPAFSSSQTSHPIEIAKYALNFTRRMVSAEVCRQMAQLVCILEMYYHETGAYPTHLSDLTPELLPQVPLDLDGQPLRNALTPGNDRYRIWSVGLDGLDEEGTRGGHIEKHHDITKPDWVWEYP